MGFSWQWSLGGPPPAESAGSVPTARPPHSALPPAHFPEAAAGASIPHSAQILSVAFAESPTQVPRPGFSSQ